MAMSDIGNGNGGSYGTTYYTRFGLRTEDGKLKLTPSYKNGLMNLNISRNKGDYTYESISFITLSPTKASILASQLEQFLRDLTTGKAKDGVAYGVDTGFKDVRPFICGTFIEGNPYITIGKVSPDGTIEQRTDYPINTKYHYGLNWKNLDKMDVEKTYYDDTEIAQLISLLKEFAKQSFGAGAAATCEMMRLDPKVFNDTITAAASKLGIEVRQSSRRSSGSTGNSFFNKGDDEEPTSSGAKHMSSIEELEESIG